MAEAEAVFSKRGAICALLPYAIRLSGGERRRMIDAFSHAFRRIISKVDTLWLIMLNDALPQHPPNGTLAWTNKQIFIPPARFWLSRREAVREFRLVGDTEILKSYLLLVWLEWTMNEDSVIPEMCASIREDFDGIGMGHHREELRKRLDHALEQLDLGPQYLNRYRPDFTFFGITTEVMRDQYMMLKRVLLEVDLTRTPFRFIILFDILTLVDTHRISLDIHV